MAHKRHADSKTGNSRTRVMKSIKGPAYPEEPGCEGPLRAGSGSAREHRQSRAKPRAKRTRKGSYMEERVRHYAG